MRYVQIMAVAVMLIASQASFGARRDASLQRAIDRGRIMYLYDRAAWLATDDMLSRLPQNRQPEVGGWVVAEAATGYQIYYFGKDTAADRVIYSAGVSGKGVSNATVYPVTSEPTLGEPALSLARALHAAWVEMARHPKWKPCANASFNPIVLPPDTDGTIPVYFLTPQTQAESFPFGGHYEVDIGRDGRTVFTRAFTRSCITLTTTPQSNGGMPAGIFITHLLDPHPTEIHIFEQHYARVPVYVGTINPQALWKVADDKVEKLDSMPAGATAAAPQMYVGSGIETPPTARLVGIKATRAQTDLDRLQAFAKKSGFPNQQTDGPEERELLIAFPPGSNSTAVTQFVETLRASSFSTLKLQSIIVPAEQ